MQLRCATAQAGQHLCVRCQDSRISTVSKPVNLSVQLATVAERAVVQMTVSHYAYMPMLYTAIFHGCKNSIFSMKKCYIFLMFAQNIDCGYTLETPQ